MARFLLVHGSCHGAWCWEKTIPLLTDLGHDVHAIDLPSHGADTTAAKDVTLDLYGQAIVNALEGPTILVGHSMAGYPITKAAEIDNSSVAGLIYLCAYTPFSGVSLADNRRRAPSQPLMDAVIKSEDGLTFSIDPTKAMGRFYHDCPPKETANAVARLCPQPILPQETAMDVTAASTDLPRAYIACTSDQTIPPIYQRTMVNDWPKKDVYEMACSHSPFYADPQGLAHLLHKISTQMTIQKDQ